MVTYHQTRRSTELVTCEPETCAPSSDPERGIIRAFPAHQANPDSGCGMTEPTKILLNSSSPYSCGIGIPGRSDEVVTREQTFDRSPSGRLINQYSRKIQVSTK